MCGACAYAEGSHVLEDIRRLCKRSGSIDHVVYEDEVSLSRVILYKHKEAIADDVTVRLWGDRMHLVGKGVDIALPFGEVSVMSVLGRNKLNIYIGQELYQLKGDKRFNAVKYMNFYYHYTNVQKGETNGEFLGLSGLGRGQSDRGFTAQLATCAPVEKVDQAVAYVADPHVGAGRRDPVDFVYRLSVRDGKTAV